jgi:hypothetical protein
MITVDAARSQLAAYLASDAAAHDAGRFDEIGRRFDSFERHFPSGDDPAVTELRIALTFWDAWINARNHEWQTTAGIQPADWPALARAVAADLAAAGRIKDPNVRARFDAVGNSGLNERVQLLASRLRERENP